MREDDAVQNPDVNSISFESFAAAARAAGYEEAVERRWDAGVELQTHTHAFAVQALVVQGGLVLTCRGQDRHLAAGDRFELAFEEPHAERYGPEGATYWVARRHSPG